MWDARELLAGKVGSWPNTAGMATLLQAAPGKQPSQVAGALAFDGTNDILSDTARSFTHLSINDLGDDVVCTGLARAPNGTWWVADHGGGSAPRLINFSADFTTRLSAIELDPIYGAGEGEPMQGLVYDTSDDTLWFAAKGYVRHIQTNGTTLTGDDIAFPTDPGGLALDEANGVLIVMQNHQDGTTIRKVSRATGATIDSSTISVTDRGHLYFDHASRALFLTSGSGGGTGKISIYSIDGSNFMDLIATVDVPELDAIEGIVYHDDKLYVCNAAKFQAGLTDVNAVMVFDAPGIVGTQWNVYGIASYPSATGTDAILTIGNPLANDGYGLALYTAGPNTMQLCVQSGGSGTGSATRALLDFTDLPSLTTPRIVHAQVDMVAETFRLWIDGTEILTTGTSTGSLSDFKGPVTDRARLNVGCAFEGTDTRNLALTTKALGYSMVAINRETVEGWLAHEFGLTANLPSDHPYKSVPPGATLPSSLTYTDSAKNAADLDLYTFPSLSIGAEAPTRLIAVCLAWRTAGTSRQVTGVTVGGVSASLAVEAINEGGGNTSKSEIWVAAVPTGTTADVVVSLSGTIVRLGVALYRLEGVASTTPNVTQVSTDGDATINLTNPSHVIASLFIGEAPAGISTASDDVPAGSLAISASIVGAGSTSWTGLSEDSDLEIEGTSGTFSALAVVAWDVVQ